jgi:hypothetical protein
MTEALVPGVCDNLAVAPFSDEQRPRVSPELPGTGGTRGRNRIAGRSLLPRPSLASKQAALESTRLGTAPRLSPISEYARRPLGGEPLPPPARDSGLISRQTMTIACNVPTPGDMLGRTGSAAERGRLAERGHHPLPEHNPR